MPSASASARLTNERGLHARPCHAIASTALAHRSQLRVRCEGREADGRSILSLMTLGAPHGSLLQFQAEGEDAEELLQRLVELVGSGFSELD